MRAYFLLMFFAMAMTASAAPRERRQMAAIAAASMQEQRAGMTGAHRVKGKIEIKEVMHRCGLSVYSDGKKRLSSLALTMWHLLCSDIPTMEKQQ